MMLQYSKHLSKLLLIHLIVKCRNLILTSFCGDYYGEIEQSRCILCVSPRVVAAIYSAKTAKSYA